MKKVFTLFAAVLLTASVFAQSPEKMSYQAIIRDASDNLITDTQIGIQISILQGSASGTAVYVETQEPTTNANGLVSIEIGTGATSDDFSAIDWANGPYFIKTETAPTGGTSYTIIGTSQLLSVPYALHAKTAETVTGTITETDPKFTSSQAANITDADITKLSNLSGVNTGDQDISGIATNAAAISTIQAEQTTQNTAIAINTAKIGYTDALVSANPDVVANTAKVGITTAQADAIVANTAKVGITTAQADAIVANTAKVGYTDALVSANTDVVANTAKVGITTAQADAIVANTAKVGITAAQVTKLDGIAENANNYIHPTGDGNLHVPATGITNSGKVLTAGATAGSLSWNALTSSQWTTTGSDIYYNTGNVGIGTSTPGYKLTIDGVGTGNTAVFGVNVTGDATFNWASSAVAPNLSAGNNIIHMIGKAESEYNSGYMGFHFNESGNSDNYLTFGLHSHDNLLNITGAGKVGIGTTQTDARITILEDASYLGINVRSTQTGTVNREKTTTLLEGSGGNYASQGNVAIKFHHNDVNNLSGDLSFWTKDNANNQYERMRIAYNGYVGIGTTDPDAPLHVNGSVGIIAGAHYFNGYSSTTDLLSGTNYNFNMSIHASNDIVANGSFVATSDKRVKENITELHNSLDLVGRLRPVSYNKIDKVEQGNRVNYGFIAQEVEAVFPEAVNTGKGEVPVLKSFDQVSFEDGVTYTILVKNGDNIKEQTYRKGDVTPGGEIIVKSKTVNDFKSLTYDMIFTVAVDAIQEQQAIIEAQQKQIDELKKMVEGLMKK